MSSPWDELDALKREHDELLAWLKKDHGGWTLQHSDGLGYVARRRETSTRAPVFARGKTVAELQKAILEEEAKP